MVVFLAPVPRFQMDFLVAIEAPAGKTFALFNKF